MENMHILDRAAVRFGIVIACLIVAYCAQGVLSVMVKQPKKYSGKVQLACTSVAAIAYLVLVWAVVSYKDPLLDY